MTAQDDYAPVCSDCGDENHTAGWPHCPFTKAQRMRSGEVNEILGWCLNMLEGVMADGANKRAAGLKPLWKIDGGHAAAWVRHGVKIDAGERYDPDSGSPHRVHRAARDLMLAYQEMAMDGFIPENPR
jgi:hypothetical protein